MPAENPHAKEQQWRSDIRVYCKKAGWAFILLWFAFLSSIGREVLEQTGRAAMSLSGYFWAITAVLSMIAGFHAWRDQKRETETLRAQLIEQEKPRPRFMNNGSKIEFPPVENKPGMSVLPVMTWRFQNTSQRTANNIRGHMMVTAASLNSEPSFQSPLEHLDEIPPGVPVNWVIQLGPIPDNAEAALIHIGFEYDDATSRKRHTQSFYMYWRGTKEGNGVALTAFFSAPAETRDPMRKYLAARRLKTYDETLVTPPNDNPSQS